MVESFLEYELPVERIAQRPVGLSCARSAARLLHVRLEGATAESVSFFDRTIAALPEILRPGDLLILNDTKVLPARFFAERAGGGEAEILLLAPEPGDGSTDSAQSYGEIWEVLARPMKRLRVQDRLTLSEGLEAEVLGRTADGDRLRLRIMTVPGETSSIAACIVRDGSMPIPGYIRDGRADDQDRTLYQTIFAREPGSVAAPTAGLHFTPELLSALNAAGIAHRFITLHVGPASFQPVRDCESHQMPAERYAISCECWEAIESTKKSGGRVVAVGTTTTRALEGAFLSHGQAGAPLQTGSTSIFITPGYRFRVVDLLLTNFHQPRTTHLLLVAAMIGEKATADAYRHALSGDYRFLSYGDAMILEGRSSMERTE